MNTFGIGEASDDNKDEYDSLVTVEDKHHAEQRQRMVENLGFEFDHHHRYRNALMEVKRRVPPATA